MEDKIKNAEEMNEQNAPADARKIIIDPRERAKRLAKGKLQLESPIRSASTDVEELEYDFSKLNGIDMANAMDKDTSANSTFRITNKQALFLFAEAAAKCTRGIDSTDILERLGIGDAIKAVQVATAFFIASSQAGNMRITTD
ncbi:MAG: hypothetical protein IJ466_07325 [Clostridia bacterium]|nr:hypothetical protein [Clostridia bacterium]